VTARSVPFFVVALSMAALPLAGCEDLNRALGRTRVIPDEFQVVSNAPLAIPPDYALRPPRVGSGRDQDQSPTDQARESVFRVGDQPIDQTQTNTSLTTGEADLLREAGATKVSSDIRQQIDSDPKQGVPFERSLVDRLIFWEGPKTPPSTNVINPSEEASRLRLSQTVASNGAPASPIVTSGDAGTPTFERTTNKSSSWFGWLF
jgi:hypothetical protein